MTRHLRHSFNLQHFVDTLLRPLYFVLCLMCLAPGLHAQTTPVSNSTSLQQFIYRTQTNDTLQKIAFLFLADPHSTQALQTLIQLNHLNTQASTKKTLVLPANTPFKIPTSLIAQTAVPAQIGHYAGEVKITDASKQIVPTDALLGEGTTLNTGPTGRITVVFPDQSRIELNANSALEIITLKQYINTPIYLIDTKIHHGRGTANVNPERDPLGRFNIQSRRTVTGVRGTVFRLEDTADDDTPQKAVVEVLKGEVVFGTNKQFVNVPASKGSYVDNPNTGPAQPIALLAPPTWASPTTQFEAGVDTLLLAFPQNTGKGIIELTLNQPSSVTHTFTISPGQALLAPTTLGAGEYTLNARALDPHQIQGEPLEKTITLVTRPFHPKHVFLQQKPTLHVRWSPVPDAYLYALEFAALKDSPPPAIKHLRTALQTYSVQDWPKGHYQVRVASIGVTLHPNAPSVDKQGHYGPWTQFNVP